MEALRNKKKPIVGAIASAITYVALKLGLDLDPELATGLAGLVFVVLVERLRPIFGEKTETPQPLTEPTPRRGAHLER